MAKQIGKGKIILIEDELLTLESDCISGNTVSTVKYTFPPSETDDVLAVDDIVLFVEDSPPVNEVGEAVNVVKIPSEGGCM